MKKTLVPLILMLIAFTAKAQHVVNGNMEHWHNVAAPVNSYCPDSNWYGLDSAIIMAGRSTIDPGSQGYTNQVYMTNSSHTLTFGARIVTEFEDTGSVKIGIVGGCLSNCLPVLDYNAMILNHTHPLHALTFTGGQAVTAAQRPGTVGAWIRYTPVGNDTAHIIAKVLNSSGTVIGSVDSAITSAIAVYAYVAPHINYTSTDTSATLQIIFTSSTLDSNRGQIGSAMWIDDVDYTIAPTGIAETNLQQNAVRFYPNPSTGVVYLYNNDNEKLSWQVFTTNGQVILNKELAAANREDLSYLPSGTYFYNVLNSKGEVVQKDKFSIVK